MGWCSATEIMDTALQAAEKVAASVAYELGAQLDDTKQEALNDHLRPFVATIAEHLRDGDWDCEQDSDYFDRFPREMLGLDDQEWEQWLVDKIQTTDYDVLERRKWMRMLEAFYAEQEESSGTAG